MTSRRFAAASLAALALALGGCHGGGGEDIGVGPGGSPLTGVWIGILNSDEIGQSGEVTALFQGGRLMIVEEEDLGRVYNGQYTSAGRLFEAPTVTRYEASGAAGATIRIRRGDVLTSGVLDVQYSVGSNPAVQTMQFDRHTASSAPASLANLNGTWAQGNAVIPIDANGSANGSDGTCQYLGIFEVIETTLNIYRVGGGISGTFTVFGCGSADGSYTGLATLLDNGNTLLMILSNTQRALHFRLAKQP